MTERLENFIAWRYVCTRGHNRFISFISLISMLGVGLGVMALIVVLSVMNGFEEELKERILGMAAHATLTSRDESGLEDWSAVAQKIKENPHVTGVAPYYSSEGMLSGGGRTQGTVVRGVLPRHEVEVSRVAEHMRVGTLQALRPGDFNIIVGSELAARLGAGLGDAVTLLTAEVNVTPAGILPRFKRFTVAGIFEVGMHEYDSALVFIHLEDACRLFRRTAADSLRIQTDDVLRAPATARAVRAALPGRYSLVDWTQRHANFFRALRTEKTVMFVILTLIVAVAVFNIISTLVMVIADKRADIAVLRTLGARPAQILGIFFVQGSIIGLAGIAAGTLAGVLVALNAEALVARIESFFDTDFLPADVYYISDLPSELHWQDVAAVGAVSMILCMAATLYPAIRAARLQPAEVLRYE